MPKVPLSKLLIKMVYQNSSSLYLLLAAKCLSKSRMTCIIKESCECVCGGLFENTADHYTSKMTGQ